MFQNTCSSINSFQTNEFYLKRNNRLHKSLNEYDKNVTSLK